MPKPPKLTPAQVEQIRQRLELYRANGPKRLAADFGVSTSIIRLVAIGRYRPRQWERES